MLVRGGGLYPSISTKIVTKLNCFSFYKGKKCNFFPYFIL
jgi:hypothetical protein